MDQDLVAARMRWLGHWQCSTVSQVERARRNLTLPEMVGLTLIIGASIDQLLNPRGPLNDQPDRRVVLASRQVEMTGEGDEMVTKVSMLAPAGWLAIDSDDVNALVCSHKTYAEVVWQEGERFLRQIEFTPGRPDLTDVGPDGPMSS